jgi:transcriptional regulator with XRE-family HTH domain
LHSPSTSHKTSSFADAEEVTLRLRTARQRRKLTQQKLADRSGLHQSVIAMLERLARPNPRWDTASKLATALGMSPYTLFGRPRRPRRRPRSAAA